MAVSVALLIGTVYLFMRVPKGFLPSEDQGRFNISTEAMQGIGVRRHGAPPDARSRRSSRKDPNIASFTSTIGRGPGGSGGSLNTGRIGGRPQAARRAQRCRSTRSSRACVRKLAQMPGMRVFMVNQPPINLGGHAGRAQPVSVHAAGHRHRRALRVGAEARSGDARPAAASRTSAATCRSRTRRCRSTIDRDKIGTLGLDGRTRSKRRSTTRTARRQVHADLRAEQPVSGRAAGGAGIPDAIRRRCRTALRPLEQRTASIPLDTVAKVTTDAGPLAVSHTGQLPSVTISFNLKPGVALGDAVDAIQRDGRGDAAVDDRDAVPGHGPGVSGFAAAASA